MAEITTDAAEVFRDYASDGVPASGAHEPIKSEIRSLFQIVDARINLAGETGAYIVKSTLAALQADLDHAADVYALVVADTSSPSANGYYVKVGSSGSGSWSYVGPDRIDEEAEAREAGDESVSARIAEFPQRSVFVSGEVLGPYLGSTGVITANPATTIDSSGYLVTVNSFSGATTTYRFWDAGHVWNGIGDVQAEVSASFGLLTLTGGPVIVLGSIATGFVFFSYFNNGTIGLYTATGTVLASTSDAGMTFTTGQVVSLRVTLREDGTGVLLATNASDDTLSLSFSARSERGLIGPAQRRADIMTISRFVVQDAATADIGDLNDELAELATSVTPYGVNGRVLGLAQQTTFVDGEWRGPYQQSDAAIAATPTWVIDGGELDITNNMSGTSYRYWTRGDVWDGRSSLEVEVEITLGTAVNTNGASIAIGSVATGYVNFLYAKNGAIGLFDETGTGVVGSTTTQAGMAFTTGDRVKLNLYIRPDGAGQLICTHPSAGSYTFDFTGVTETGIVGPSQRRADTTTINTWRCASGSDVRAEAIEDRLAIVEAAVDVVTVATLLRWGVLPDASSSRDPLGFTSTGISKLTRGAYKWCWVVADDGRLVEGDASPYIPRVHIISPDFQRILSTIDPGYSSDSAQGVVVDTTGSEDTIWLATSGDEHIRHYELDGTEITGDAVDLGALSIPGSANGLAFDAANDMLYLTTTTDGTLYKISGDPGDSPRLVDTFTLGDSSPDQLFYSDGVIYYTVGANGSAGSVKTFTLATEVTASFATLELIEAVEGLHIEDNVLTMVSDGGYHDAAEPALNIWAQYRLPASA
jgi:hypothetical protein